MKHEHKEPPRREYPSDKRIREACEKAAIGALKETMADNPSRLVRSIEKHEISWIVGHVLTAYTNARAAEARAECASGLFADDIHDLL